MVAFACGEFRQISKKVYQQRSGDQVRQVIHPGAPFLFPGSPFAFSAFHLICGNRGQVSYRRGPVSCGPSLDQRRQEFRFALHGGGSAHRGDRYAP